MLRRTSLLVRPAWGVRSSRSLHASLSRRSKKSYINVGTKPNIQLPHGYNFYPDHNDYPLPPPIDPSKVYTSDEVRVPHIPRRKTFHFIFPPKQKGRPHEWYPTPPHESPGFIDGLTGRELLREEIPTRAMWLYSGIKQLGFNTKIYKRQVGCIFGQNSLEWIEACYGIHAADGIVSPINAASTPAEVLHQLMDTEATFIFVQPELVPVLEQALSMAPPTYNIKPEHILLLCERENIPEGIPYQCITDAWHRQARPRQITDDRDKDTVFICYSSGTGGPPKGVEITHHNMASQLQAVNALYEPLSWKNDKVLAVLPFSHIYGLTLLVHHPLMRGAATVVLPKFDPVQIFQTIQKYRITFMLVVPPMMVAMMNHPDFDIYDLSSLRGVLTGAAPCSPELIAKFEARFPQVVVTRGYGIDARTVRQSSTRVTQGYGMTETSPVSHVMTVEEGTRKPGTVGKLLPTYQARLVDPATGEDVEAGERGELWLRGPSVMKGYWKNPEATKEAFAPGGWFKTGDLAQRDDDGYWTIVDRIKELIKYKGFQVPPAELEALLITHPKIADAGVIGVYDESQATELPRAYVVPKSSLQGLGEEDRASLCEEIVSWVEGKTSNHKRLRGGVRLLEKIPKSGSGKILRKDLRQMALEEEAAGKSPQSGAS